MTLPGTIRRVAALAGVPDSPTARRWAWVAVVDAIGTGMFLPVSVLYFTVVVHLSAESVGLGLGIAGLVGCAATPVAGALIDRWGAKRLLIICWLAAGAAYAGFLGVHNWGSFVAIAAVAQAADHMIVPGRRVFVTSIATGDDRVSLMSFQRAMLNVGFGIGGLLTAAALAIGTRSAYQAILVVDAVSYLAATGVMATIAVPRNLAGQAPESPAADSGTTRKAGFREVLADWRYVSLALIDVTVLTYASTFTIGMPLWVHLHTSAPTSMVGLLFTLNTVLVVVLQLRTARTCSTLEQAPRAFLRTAGAFALAAVGYWAAYRAGRAEALVIVLLIAAVLAHTMAELYGSVGEWTVSLNLAPENLRGRYLSLFGLSLSAQQTVGPVLVTALIVASPDLAWFALAGLLAAGCAATIWLVAGAAVPQEAVSG